MVPAKAQPFRTEGGTATGTEGFQIQKFQIPEGSKNRESGRSERFKRRQVTELKVLHKHAANSIDGR